MGSIHTTWKEKLVLCLLIEITSAALRWLSVRIRIILRMVTVTFTYSGHMAQWMEEGWKL